MSQVVVFMKIGDCDGVSLCMQDCFIIT